MSLPVLLASLLSNEAEAKTVFAGSSGEVPVLPIDYKYKAFSDVLGKEPASFEEFKQLKKELYNKLRKESPNTAPGLILHDIEQRLSQPVLHKLGAADLKDVSSKVQSAMGLTPEQRARLHQIYIEQPSNITSGGKTFPFIRERGAEPIPDVVEATAMPAEADTHPHEGKTFFGLPFTGKERNISLDAPEGASLKDLSSLATKEYSENVNPVAKIGYNPYKKISDEGISYPNLPAAASDAFHEALHQYYELMNEYKASRGKKGVTLSPKHTYSESQDFTKKLKGKDADYENAMKKLKFSDHFAPEMVEGKPEYGLDYWLSKMNHPEWFAKKEALKQMVSPTPSPIPIDEE